jgi:hypothetical protein
MEMLLIKQVAANSIAKKTSALNRIERSAVAGP